MTVGDEALDITDNDYLQYLPVASFVGVGFWLMPLERRLFHIKDPDKALAIIPAAPLGLAAVCVF